MGEKRREVWSWRRSLVGEKKKEKRKGGGCTWVVGEKRKEKRKEKKKKKKEGNGNKGREREKKLRKEGILGVVEKINLLKNEIVMLK